MSSRNKKKSKHSRRNGANSPSPTAQILEHVELLVALCEEQGEPVGSLAKSDVNASDIAQKLESQIAKRFDSLEEQLASSDSSQDSDDPKLDGSSLKSIIERFDSLESKLTAIEKKRQGADTPQLSAAKIQERFEALDDRIGKITTAIEGQQRLIEERNQNVDSSDIDALQSQFSKMLNQMKQEMGSIAEIGQRPDQLDETENDPTDSDSETKWNRQKEAMLSKYGIDPEHRPDMAPPTAPDPVQETTQADKELSASPALGSEEKVSIEDPEEIQKIKQELNSKLRDAEVELSIERAKLSQLHAELETKQVELDRRDTELTEKFIQQKNSSNSPQEQAGILDRLKKHLTAKDRKNLDRI